MDHISLSTDEVKHLGELARIALSEQEVAVFQHQLTEVIDYNIQLLQELDVSETAPTLQTSGLANVWRPDDPEVSLSQETALSNAPAAEAGQFVVKKVLGESS